MNLFSKIKEENKRLYSLFLKEQNVHISPIDSRRKFENFC